MKKYLIKVNLIFAIGFLILAHPFVSASLPLVGKTIVVDVGHGGN